MSSSDGAGKEVGDQVVQSYSKAHRTVWLGSVMDEKVSSVGKRSRRLVSRERFLSRQSRLEFQLQVGQ